MRIAMQDPNGQRYVAESKVEAMQLIGHGYAYLDDEPPTSGTSTPSHPADVAAPDARSNAGSQPPDGQAKSGR